MVWFLNLKFSCTSSGLLLHKILYLESLNPTNIPSDFPIVRCFSTDEESSTLLSDDWMIVITLRDPKECLFSMYLDRELKREHYKKNWKK